MRLAGVLIALALVNGFAFAQQPIENATHGYSLEIPEGWHEVPAEFLTEFSRSVSSPEHPINYVAAYQKARFVDALVYPYLLIQSIPYRDFKLDRPPTPAEMDTIVESIIGMDIAEAVQDWFSEDVRELIDDEPTIHLRSFSDGAGVFVYEVNIDVANVGRIHGRARGVFGKRALLQPAYFILEKDWTEAEGEANQVLDSFEFSPDYQYPADAADAGTEFISMDEISVGIPESWVFAAGGTLAVILIAIALALVMRTIDRRK